MFQIVKTQLLLSDWYLLHLMKVVYSIKVKLNHYQTWGHHIFAIILIFEGQPFQDDSDFGGPIGKWFKLSQSDQNKI